MNQASGNALFLILIAVALLAALSYAITQSGRGGGSADKEAAHLEAARIMTYAAEVRAAVQRLMLLNNAQVQDIHFHNDMFLLFGGNGIELPMGDPEDPSLYVFHPKGGGVTPQVFERFGDGCASCTNSSWRPGHSGFRYRNVMGTDTGDVILQINRLSDDVCRAINAAGGISGIPAATFAEAERHIHGAPPPTGMEAPSGPGLDRLEGAYEFCFLSSVNIFFAVLVAH